MLGLARLARLSYNPLVMFISLSLSFGAIVSGISAASDDASLSNEIKIFRTTASLIAGLTLSLFIIKGLFDIKQQDKKLHDELLEIGRDYLDPVEEEHGTTQLSTGLAITGMTLSGLSMGLNTIQTVMIVRNIDSPSSATIGPGWLLTGVIVTSASNLLGFVLFNTLGARNVLVLLDKNKVENTILVKLNEELYRKVTELSAKSAGSPGGAAMPFLRAGAGATSNPLLADLPSPTRSEPSEAKDHEPTT